MSVIDPATYGISAVLAVGSDAVDVAIDGTARRAYVANAGDASISVVDLDALTVVGTVPLTGGPSAVAVDELAQVGYVLALNTVRVVDTGTGEVVRTIELGEGPSGMTLQPASGSVFVIGADSSGQGWAAELTAG